LARRQQQDMLAQLEAMSAPRDIKMMKKSRPAQREPEAALVAAPSGGVFGYSVFLCLFCFSLWRMHAYHIVVIHDTFRPGRCVQCQQMLLIGQIVVFLGRLGPDGSYVHPACMTCSECGELLVQLRYCVDYGWVCVRVCACVRVRACGWVGGWVGGWVWVWVCPLAFQVACLISVRSSLTPHRRRSVSLVRNCACSAAATGLRIAARGVCVCVYVCMYVCMFRCVYVCVSLLLIRVLSMCAVCDGVTAPMTMLEALFPPL
jgi:hypothetical protein